MLVAPVTLNSREQSVLPLADPAAHVLVEPGVLRNLQHGEHRLVIVLIRYSQHEGGRGEEMLCGDAANNDMHVHATANAGDVSV